MKMKYIGNYVLNNTNCKIDGDYIYVDQNNQVRNLVYTTKNKGKKLWVRFQQMSVDTLTPPFKIKFHVEINPNKKYSKEMEFHYDFRDQDIDDVVKFLNEKIMNDIIKPLDEKDEKIGKFDFKVSKYHSFELQMYGYNVTTKMVVELSENLTRVLGFTENKFERSGWYVKDDMSIMPYGKSFLAPRLPKFQIDFSRGMPVLYYYHPDLISSNFNQEYISAVYIKGHETFEYDLMYDVNSFSPTAKTHFYYYEDGKKLFYTPSSFVIVLGFYESD